MYMPVTKMKEHPPISPDDFILGCPGHPSGNPAMPREAIHIVAGGSGSGKTTAVFQLLAGAQHHTPFFGYPTKPVRAAYVTYDRTYEQTKKSMIKCGLDPAQVPYCRYQLELPDDRQKLDQRTMECLTQILTDHPTTNVIVIDGFSMLASHGKINDYLQCAVWLQRTNDWLAAHNVSLIGICHMSKQRTDSRITDPRAYALGSSAQGGSVATILTMEHTSSDGDSPYRRMYVCPRDLPQQRLELMMDNSGRLVPTDRSDEVAAASDSKPGPKTDDRNDVIEAYVALKGTAKTADILDHCREVGISRATTFRALEALVASGTLTCPKKGTYVFGGASAPGTGSDASAPPFEPTSTGSAQ